MKLIKGKNGSKDIWILNCTYDERFTPKKAGFWWNSLDKFWYTQYPEKAFSLKEFADDTIKIELEKLFSIKEEKIQQSKAVDSDFNPPAPEGLNYFPFQKAGINYAVNIAAGNVLIADDMGLGKTIQAIGIMNCFEKPKKVLVICPATVKINWSREIEKWSIHKYSIQVLTSKSTYDDDDDADVIIVNYQSLKKFEQLQTTEWDYLIVDEAHYIKNYKAQRTKQVVSIPAKKRIFLAGTPIVNRPIELYSILCQMGFRMKFWTYAKRYCGAVSNGYGWDMSGATNLDELQKTLREKFMIRRLKKDVLTDLPAKLRQVIEIPANGLSKFVKAEEKALKEKEEIINKLKINIELSKVSDNPDDYEKAINDLKQAMSFEFSEIARVRHETAIAKISLCTEHIIDSLENSNKIVVFAHHRDVLETLEKELNLNGIKTVKVYGGMNEQKKQEAIDNFQNDSTIQIFLGSIKACSEGITLTAASHVIFIELDWTPSAISQAEDRCHRIGQINNVLVQHLVLENSIDSHFAKTIVEKQKVIDDALDKETKQEIEIIIPSQEKHITITKVEVEKEAIKITKEQKEAILQALKIVAGMCDGAFREDGAGFNKIDAGIGKSLAEYSNLTFKQAVLSRKIVMKYKRQYPAELFNIIKGE